MKHCAATAKERRKSEEKKLSRWTALLAMLEQKRVALEALNNLMTLLRDIDALSAELLTLEVRFFFHARIEDLATKK